MKNLLIYVNPSHYFGFEEKITAKIQIDNSLDLGWKREDIVLVTNFPYEYKGVKAQIVGDENYCDFQPTMTKINTIVDLFKGGLFEDGELYWYHDFDVYQNEVITQSEIETELVEAEIGLTDKGRMPRWNAGTLFFKKNSADIFTWTKYLAYKYKTWDEPALMALSTNNLLWVIEPKPEITIGDRVIPVNTIGITGMENVGERVKKINISYNFRMWNINSTYPTALKPIRAVHFHPYAHLLYNGPDEMGFFMYGKNKIKTVLMSARLVEIFHKHGLG